MKKAVKSLIIATAVAAIAGIGAVSFAAWNKGATNNTAQSGGTNLGTVEIHGGFVKNGDEEYAALTLVKENEDDELHLVPWDQGEGTVKLVFAIPDYQVQKDVEYRLWLTATGLNGNDSSFKYQIGEDAAEAPADDDEFAAWGYELGYIYLGDESRQYAVEETPTENATISGMMLTVILDSSEFSDMGAEIEFTLHFEEGDREEVSVEKPRPPKPEGPLED